MKKVEELGDEASEIMIRNDLRREIIKTVLMLIVVSKDLNIDIWEVSDDDALGYFM